MAKDNVIELKNPEPFCGSAACKYFVTGARQLLAATLEVEAAVFLQQYNQYIGETVENDRCRVMRNGYLPKGQELGQGSDRSPYKLYVSGLSTISLRGRQNADSGLAVPVSGNERLDPLVMRFDDRAQFSPMIL